MAQGVRLKNIAPTSIAGIILGFAYGLPQPYAHYATLVIVGLFCLSILLKNVPSPPLNSKWRIVYLALLMFSASFGENPPKDGNEEDNLVKNDDPILPEIDNIISKQGTVLASVIPTLIHLKGKTMDNTSTDSTQTQSAAPAATVASTTTATSTVNASSITNLISAGEGLYEAISGKSDANSIKVISGISAIADVMLPAIDARIGVSVEDIIGGTSEVINGVTAIVKAVKVKK